MPTWWRPWRWRPASASKTPASTRPWDWSRNCTRTPARTTSPVCPTGGVGRAARRRSRAQQAFGGAGVGRLLDLDGFKSVNDRYGHQTGDLLLQQFAESWRRIVRLGGDFVARLGGDEFGLLAPGTTSGGVRNLAQRHARGEANGISYSFGVATWDGSEAPGQLMHRADMSMYRSSPATWGDGDGAVGSTGYRTPLVALLPACHTPPHALAGRVPVGTGASSTQCEGARPPRTGGTGSVPGTPRSRATATASPPATPRTSPSSPIWASHTTDCRWSGHGWSRGGCLRPGRDPALP